MKKNLTILSAMVLTLLIYWYFSSDNLFTAPPRVFEPLVFRQEQLSRSFGPCETETAQCLTIKLGYPVAYNGPDSSREWLNSFIHGRLVENLFPGELPGDPGEPLDTLALELADDYLDVLEESPGYAPAWAFDIKAEIILQTKDLLTLEIGNYSYMGGAHPNAFRELYTLDLKDLRELGIKDLVSDTIFVKDMAEKHFRKERGIATGSSLNEEGFFFPGDHFTFPANVGLAEKGVKFIYNPYEIGPYALGFTEFTIPYGELEGKMKTD